MYSGPYFWFLNKSLLFEVFFATETRGGEPAMEAFSGIFSFKGKKSSIASFQSDTSIGRKKKAPTDLCDIKALIAELKASPSFMFKYLIFAVPQWSIFYTPYCLK